MALIATTRAKQGPNVRSFSQIKYFGACPYRVASRRCCATQGSVGDLVTPTWITRRVLSSMRKNAKTVERRDQSPARNRRPRYLPNDCAERSPISVLLAGVCEQ